ncbi:uncharacterized protein A1O9_06613 [Exophiala aquamarina CBS 119918]|uniref:Amidohydrolase-related domain-containing protein n=1 Tax=Exophiala aquamarina CBS 119918 TaxID=1182545 RepID=A0A072PFZ8_9EURO|nr:uncharacterized protein A1O9_06613 [Exophiala aquamarina CBS 119918]KEF58687.1 hypothetical protein A1O9_06613 [Exophiala aquamarina CBS 119918]
MATKYIIKNITVISVDDEIGNVRNCDVLIDDGAISAVGSGLTHSTDHTIIDGTNAIVSPGFFDTHRHTWQCQLKSVATDFALSDYVLALRHINGASYIAHDAYIGNLCGALESIDNGTTYLVDHSQSMNSSEHADAAVKGLLDSKIRGVFRYALYPNPAWEGSCMDKEREVKTPNWRLNDAHRIRETYFKSTEPEDILRFGFASSEPNATQIDKLVSENEFSRSIGAAVIGAHISFRKRNPGNCIVRQHD